LKSKTENNAQAGVKKRGDKRWLRLYIVVLTMVAVLLTTWLALTPGNIDARDIMLGAFFATLIALAGIYPIHLSPKTKVSVSTAAVFAVILLFNPLLAVVITALGVATAHAVKKRSWFNSIFSISQAIIFSGMAAVIFNTLNPDGVFNTAGAIVGLVLSALVMYLVNSVAVAIIAGLQMRKNPVVIWISGTKQSAVQELALMTLGFVAAALASQFPWAIIFLVIPVIVIYHSFKRLMALNEQVKNQLDELKVTQAQLVESARLASVGTMVAGIAHQINNPMFVIRGRAETLMLDAEKHLKTESTKKHVQTIYEMADRVSKVVNSLLPVSQVTDDGSACADVNECTRNAVSLLESKLLKANIKLDMDLAQELRTVCGEACEIQELVINLVDNACNAMPQGGKLTLRTEPVGDAVLLRVIDSGTGILPENISKIFSPFFSTRKGGGGIGLGLYVARHIAQKHGGVISVSSEPGKGSSFSVVLPIAASKAKAKVKPVASDNDSLLHVR
jgi:signal transduction histidine kinase